jgi:hypothetical protein
MAFNAVEVIALIVALLIIVKLLVVSFSPKAWWNLAKSLYKANVALFVVELVLALVVFYFLLQQITLVQLMAAIGLGALLTGMTFAVYAKETIDWGTKILRSKSLWARSWLPILIWLGLAVWTLVELF